MLLTWQNRSCTVLSPRACRVCISAWAAVDHLTALDACSVGGARPVTWDALVDGATEGGASVMIEADAPGARPRARAGLTGRKDGGEKTQS